MSGESLQKSGESLEEVWTKVRRKSVGKSGESPEKSRESLEKGPPGPDDLDAAAGQQNGDQRHPPVLPPPTEDLLPKTMENLPVDIKEETTPPPC